MLLDASAAIADASNIAPAGTGSTEVEQADPVATEEPAEPEEDADTEDLGPPPYAPAHGFRAQPEAAAHAEDDGEDREAGPPFSPPGLRDRPGPPSNVDGPDRDGPPAHAPAHGRSENNDRADRNSDEPLDASDGAPKDD